MWVQGSRSDQAEEWAQPCPYPELWEGWLARTAARLHGRPCVRLQNPGLQALHSSCQGNFFSVSFPVTLLQMAVTKRYLSHTCLLRSDHASSGCQSVQLVTALQLTLPGLQIRCHPYQAAAGHQAGSTQERQSACCLTHPWPALTQTHLAGAVEVAARARVPMRCLALHTPVAAVAPAIAEEGVQQA